MKFRKMGIIVAGLVGSLLIGNNVYGESYGSVNVPVIEVRQSPLESASVIEKYKENETVKIIERISPEWYAIENDKGQTAYINTRDVNIFKVKARVNANGVNTRTYPTTDSKVIRQFDEGQEVSIHYQVGDWYYMSLGTEPFFGFVHKSYIEDRFLYLVPTKDISEVKEVKIKARAKSQVKDVKATKAKEVIDYAKKFLGNPYRYGGNSLTRGVDCSGFTQQVMRKQGVSLQRSSSAQYANNGVKVSTKDLQAGDLLFYGYNGRVSHVAIYVGNQKVIHASNSKTGITMGNAFPTRGKPLIGAKRVV